MFEKMKLVSVRGIQHLANLLETLRIWATFEVLFAGLIEFLVRQIT